MLKKIFINSVINFILIPSILLASNIVGDKEETNIPVRLVAQGHEDLSTFGIQNFLTNYIDREGYLNNKSPDEITQKLKDLILSSDKDAQLRGYQELADHGDIRAMVFLANNIREQDPHMALKWYLLAFQKEWLEKRTHSNLCINAIKKLKDFNKINDNSKKFFNNFLTTYTITYSLTDHIVYDNREINSREVIACAPHYASFISSFYSNELDDYSNKYEKTLKHIMFLGLIIQSYSKTSQNLTMHYYSYGAELIKAVQQGILTKEFYEKARLSLEKSGIDAALFLSAKMYESNFVGSDLTPEQREQKVIKLYKQSATRQAYFELGKIHVLKGFDENTPQPLRKKFFDIGYNWYSQAETPDAYIMMASLLMENHVELKINKQQLWIKIKEYLLKSDTAMSWYYLGDQYLNLKSPEKISDEQSYQEAEKCYRTSVDKGELKSYLNLGYMYHSGFIGQELSKEKRISRAADCYNLSKSHKRYFFLAHLYYEQQIENGFNDLGELYKILYLTSLASLNNYAVDQEFVFNIINEIENLNSCTDVESDEELDAFSSLSIKDNTSLNYIKTEPAGQVILPTLVHTPQDTKSITTTVTTVENSNPDMPLEKRKKIDQKTTKNSRTSVNSKNLIRDNRKTLQKTMTTSTSSLSSYLSTENLTPKYEICFANKEAKKDYDDFFNSKARKKIEAVFEEILENPCATKGLGHPEVLKGNLKGYWSRRIDGKSRIIYTIEPGKVIIYDMKGYHH